MYIYIFVYYHILTKYKNKQHTSTCTQRITDEVSGQILRGHVRLESLRMKQDILLLSSIMIPLNATNEDFIRLREEIEQCVSQRVRNLAAHEVGHSLGLAHNFAANSQSVMDYPPPIIVIDDNGKLVLNSESYMSHIGDFDKVSIDFAYRKFTHTDYDEYVSHHTNEAARGFEISSLDKDYLMSLERIEMGENLFNYVYLNDQDLDQGLYLCFLYFFVSSDHRIVVLEFILKCTFF